MAELFVDTRVTQTGLPRLILKLHTAIHPMKDKKFRRREWLFAILLVAMFEYWLITVSYSFDRAQEVINYISFAASIASIILAVIAIIWGFYQSDSQKKTGADVAAQVKILEDAASKFNEVVEKFRPITTAVDSMVESTDKNTRNLSEFVDTLNEELHTLRQTSTLLSSTVSSMSESVGQLGPKIDEIRQNTASLNADQPIKETEAALASIPGLRDHYSINIPRMLAIMSPSGFYSLYALSLAFKSSSRIINLEDIEKNINTEVAYIHGFLMAIDSTSLIDLREISTSQDGKAGDYLYEIKHIDDSLLPLSKEIVEAKLDLGENSALNKRTKARLQATLKALDDQFAPNSDTQQ